MITRLLLIVLLVAPLTGCATGDTVVQPTRAPSERFTPPPKRTAQPETTTTTAAPPATTTSSTTTTTTTTMVTTTTGPPAAPILADSGFSYTGDGDLSYAVVIDNPSQDGALLSLWLDINFIDDRNRIVDTTIEVVDFLTPGARTALGGSIFEPPENVVAIEVEGEWESVRVGDAEAGVWTVSELEYDDGFFEQITGFVSHTFGDDMDLVQMTAVFYDADGNIVGGDWGFVDVPVDREVAFEIALFGPPRFDHFEVFVAP